MMSDKEDKENNENKENKENNEDNENKKNDCNVSKLGDNVKKIKSTKKNITNDENNKISNQNPKHIQCDKIDGIVYIGEIIKKDSRGKGKWKLKYECSKEIMTKNNGRIYFIEVDGKIYKIGSSSCKGGIKNTFGFYEAGLSGSPSLRTFGIYTMIKKCLDDGKKIKIYALFSTEIKVTMRGITTKIEKITYPQIQDMENLCREDYKKIYGKYPPWNFQENCEEWPDDIKKQYQEQVCSREEKNKEYKKDKKDKKKSSQVNVKSVEDKL